jgi:hypothetical protein
MHRRDRQVPSRAQSRFLTLKTTHKIAGTMTRTKKSSTALFMARVYRLSIARWYELRQVPLAQRVEIQSTGQVAKAPSMKELARVE